MAHWDPWYHFMSCFCFSSKLHPVLGNFSPLTWRRFWFDSCDVQLQLDTTPESKLCATPSSSCFTPPSSVSLSMIWTTMTTTGAFSALCVRTHRQGSPRTERVPNYGRRNNRRDNRMSSIVAVGDCTGNNNKTRHISQQWPPLIRSCGWQHWWFRKMGISQWIIEIIRTFLRVPADKQWVLHGGCRDSSSFSRFYSDFEIFHQETRNCCCKTIIRYSGLINKSNSATSLKNLRLQRARHFGM